MTNKISSLCSPAFQVDKCIGHPEGLPYEINNHSPSSCELRHRRTAVDLLVYIWSSFPQTSRLLRYEHPRAISSTDDSCIAQQIKTDNGRGSVSMMYIIFPHLPYFSVIIFLRGLCFDGTWYANGIELHYYYYYHYYMYVYIQQRRITSFSKLICSIKVSLADRFSAHNLLYPSRFHGAA